MRLFYRHPPEESHEFYESARGGRPCKEPPLDPDIGIEVYPPEENLCHQQSHKTKPAGYVTAVVHRLHAREPQIEYTPPGVPLGVGRKTKALNGPPNVRLLPPGADPLAPQIDRVSSFVGPSQESSANSCRASPLSVSHDPYSRAPWTGAAKNDRSTGWPSQQHAQGGSISPGPFPFLSPFPQAVVGAGVGGVGGAYGCSLPKPPLEGTRAGGAAPTRTSSRSDLLRPRALLALPSSSRCQVQRGRSSEPPHSPLHPQVGRRL